MQAIKRIIDAVFYSLWLSISVLLIVGLLTGKWSTHATTTANALKGMLIVLPWLCLFMQIKGPRAGYLFTQAIILGLLTVGSVFYLIDHSLVKALPILIFAAFHAVVLAFGLFIYIGRNQ